MKTVGVREIRQRASELLRMVEHGETIEITDRGRPVAMLIPHPNVGPLERLRLNGDLDPPTANLDDLPYPPRSTAPVPPTEVLTSMRSTER